MDHNQTSLLRAIWSLSTLFVEKASKSLQMITKADAPGAQDGHFPGDTWGGHFWPKGHYLNKLGRRPCGSRLEDFSMFPHIRKRAKIRNRHNQAPHLTQDTNGKVTTSQKDITNDS